MENGGSFCLHLTFGISMFEWRLGGSRTLTFLFMGCVCKKTVEILKSALPLLDHMFSLSIFFKSICEKALVEMKNVL